METMISCEEIEDFRIVSVICCVWGKDTSIGQHTQTIWQLSAGDDSCFKNEHFTGHSRLDSILGSYSIPGIDSPTPSPHQFEHIVFY